MAQVWFFFGVLVMFAVAGVDSAHAPAPSDDCSSLIANMGDCSSFVANGSTETMPQSTCCSELETLVEKRRYCLCDLFESSSQFGVQMNMTRAESLTTICRISVPEFKCGVGPPDASSAQSPVAIQSVPISQSPVANQSVVPTSAGILTPVPFMLLFSVVIASCSLSLGSLF